MSRKSAYALKARDQAFATAWNAALRASEGDKAGKADGSPYAASQVNGSARAAASDVPPADDDSARLVAERQRDLFFATLASSAEARPRHA
jgi:hypothetical protein